jgi:PAP2 superfamily
LVKSFGSLESVRRTPDQAETAFFWFEDIPIWNDIARTVIQQQHMGRWRAARILALLNFALADSGIACFEAKYRFRFWRPYTAIRRAAEDGNDGTQADPDWLPLLWTPPDMPPTFTIPPIPDYPSFAAVSSAAAAEVLTKHVGDRVGFEATSATLPHVTRHFVSFRRAAHEAGMSRVFGGIHFLHAVKDGFEQGRGIGREVSRMLPRAQR